MQLRTLACLGFVLAAICLLQVASGSKDCKLSELEKLSKDFCGLLPVQSLCDDLLDSIRRVCVKCGGAGNKEKESSSTTTTTTTPAH